MYPIYENIKKRRQSLNMSQQELAESVGYSGKSMISQIEKGLIDMPITMVPKFAKALNCTESYLMGWEEEHTFSEGFIEKLSKYPPEEVERAMEIIDLYEKASPEGRAAFETLLKLSQQKP